MGFSDSSSFCGLNITSVSAVSRSCVQLLRSIVEGNENLTSTRSFFLNRKFSIVGNRKVVKLALDDEQGCHHDKLPAI